MIISQGYPLVAVHADGTSHYVVGWTFVAEDEVWYPILTLTGSKGVAVYDDEAEVRFVVPDPMLGPHPAGVTPPWGQEGPRS